MPDLEEYGKILEEADRIGTSMTVEKWNELAVRAEEILGDRKDLMEALARYFPGDLL